MAEAIYCVCEFGEDRGVDLGRIVEDEGVDHRLDTTREFLEHEMLVLHFRGEARGLEQAFAIPDEASRSGRNGSDVNQQPLVDERQIARRQDRGFIVLDDAIVLGVEDRMDGREGDILIAAPVAGNEVRVEHLVIVGQAVAVIAGARGGVCHLTDLWRRQDIGD